MSESFLPLLFLVHHTYCDAEANQLASEKSRNDCVRFLFGANKTFSSASGFKKDGHARARHQHKPENAGNSGLEVGNTLKCSILSPPRPEGARRRDSSNLLLRNMHIRVERSSCMSAQLAPASNLFCFCSRGLFGQEKEECNCDVCLSVFVFVFSHPPFPFLFPSAWLNM